MDQRPCTGSFVESWSIPSPLADGAHDRPPAGLDRDVLDADDLPSLAPVLVERLEQRRVGADQPVRLVQGRAPAVVAVCVPPPARPLEVRLGGRGAETPGGGGGGGGVLRRAEPPPQLV